VLEAIPDGRGVHMLDGKMQDDATWKQCKVMVGLAEMLAGKDPSCAEAYGMAEGGRRPRRRSAHGKRRGGQRRPGFPIPDPGEYGKQLT
jgi:hypothetical protein